MARDLFRRPLAQDLGHPDEPYPEELRPQGTSQRGCHPPQPGRAGQLRSGWVGKGVGSGGEQLYARAGEVSSRIPFSSPIASFPLWLAASPRCTSLTNSTLLLLCVRKVPDADVPIRSVSIASDGSMLVAGNNKVGHAFAHFEPSLYVPSYLLHFSFRQGNVYVWKFEPGSDTDLQPVTMFGAHSKYITKVLLSPDVKCVLSCPFLSGIQELSYPSSLKQGWSRLISVLSLLPLLPGSAHRLDTSRRAQPTRQSKSGRPRTLSSSSSACSRATSAGCGTVPFRPIRRTSSLVRRLLRPSFPPFFQAEVSFVCMWSSWG